MLSDCENSKNLQALEALAADLLIRDVKVFTLFDIKNLDIENS